MREANQDRIRGITREGLRRVEREERFEENLILDIPYFSELILILRAGMLISVAVF